MAKGKKRIVLEQPPHEVPLYTLWDVARYLRTPLWAVVALAGRTRFWPDPEFFFHHLWRGAPVLWAEDEFSDLLGPRNAPRITFRRFADLFVRAGVLQALAELSETEGVNLDRREGLHRSILRGLEDTRHEPIPFDNSSPAERAEQTASPFLDRLDEGQAALVLKHLVIRFDRVAADDGVPLRVYPPSRDPAASPKTIVMDPSVRFGRPTLAGRGLPTDVLFERYSAGDSAAELAEDYGITVAEVDEAIRFESKPTPPFFPFYGW